MQQFSMEVAGCVGAVTAEFDSTPAYFAPYRTEKPGEFSAAPTERDRLFEQNASIEEALALGIRPRRYTPPHLERAAILRCFAEFGLSAGALMIHGSSLALDGEGYLFVAPCGTGKSTHARLWRQTFGERVVMVNDDKPFVRRTPEGVQVCGSPWCGKHGLGNNISVPLKGICILERGRENTISPLAKEEALPMLLPHCYRSLRPEQAGKEASLAAEILETVPVWRMQCNMACSAATVAWNAMKKRENAENNP